MSLSNPAQVRDAIFTRLSTSAFPFKSVRKVPATPVQAIDQLPACGVFLIRDSSGADGDPDVSIPRYLTDATISVVITNVIDSGVNGDTTVDTLADLVKTTLLSDITFLALENDQGQTIITSIPVITRNFDYPKDGESTYVQCRMQFTFRIYEYFPPVITNDFNTMVTTVQPPNQSSLAGVAPSNPANFTAEFETTPPQVAITTLGGFTNSAAQTIAGTALPGSGAGVLGTVYLFDSQLPLPIGSSSVSGGGAWSISITLAALGQRTLFASCMDNLGNAGTSAPVVFNLVTGTP